MNIASLNSQAQLYKTNLGLETTLARLSSGLRINSAADDAAGLATANRFRMDNAGLQVGIRNANDDISNLQIEDGSANNISADMAQEAANLTKYNILNQSGLAALAQANQESASVLSLSK
jgi:flagellin